jgi:hypothetical protein
MKKNLYGNIEDILLSCTVVTPTGTLSRDLQVPRISAGPDVQQMILGELCFFVVFFRLPVLTGQLTL